MPTMKWGKLTVEFSYRPGEPTTLEYPGCPEEVEIEDVLAGGISLGDELSWAIYSDIKKDAEYFVWEKIREERKNREEG